jgi:uncharacterized protein (TIGR02453 family)
LATPFRGWSDAALEFYRDLELQNDRSFWLAHKPVYDTEVRAPFEALGELVAEEFGPLRVFRPNRDVRFSKDKAPYKTRCYAVTEGEGGQAYYVEISAQGLVAATGFWMMAGDQLTRYRQAVDDDRAGAALEGIVAQIEGQGLTLEGPGLKTAPRGYARDHRRVDLLRRKSVAAIRRFPPAGWLGTPSAATRIVDVWRAGGDMNAWLAAHVGPSTEPPPARR